MQCPYCTEYTVDDIPEGDGGWGNKCNVCTEYTIPTTNVTGDYYWLPDEKESK